MIKTLAIICSILLAATNAFAAGTDVYVLGYAYKNITTDATTVVKAGPGLLHTISINTPLATTTITIYDNTAASGTKIGTYTIAASPQPSSVTYDVNFLIGLTIVTGTASSDITVSYR